jgi:ABC-type multidrug transport system permease subunit
VGGFGSKKSFPPFFTIYCWPESDKKKEKKKAGSKYVAAAAAIIIIIVSGCLGWPGTVREREFIDNIYRSLLLLLLLFLLLLSSVCVYGVNAIPARLSLYVCVAYR